MQESLTLRPELKAYDDYRVFLRDYASFRKARSTSWSYSVWAQRLGLRSHSSLVMAIRGQRAISRPLVQKLVSYFNFNKAEESYFRTLIRVSGKNKIHVHEVPTELGPRPVQSAVTPAPFLTADESARLLKWQTFVVKESALLGHNDLDRATLDVLIKSGLLKDESGSLQVGDGKPVMAWTKEAVRDLHVETLRASERAFDELPPEQRAFRLSFVRMKKEKMAEAIVVLRQFQKDFTDAFDDAQGDDVFELNLHYFAVKPHKN